MPLLEEIYPALAPQIARMRLARIPESIIEEGIERQLRDAQAQGYTRQQVETVARQGLKHPMPDYTPGGIPSPGARDAFAAFQKEMAGIGKPPEQPGLMSAFGRGVLRGLTLGYAGESTPEHPLATIAGEILGGVAPGVALFAASAPVGGIAAGLVGASRLAPYAARFGPLAARLGLARAVPGATATQLGSAGIGALAREAATGAAFGGLWKPEGEGGMGARLEQAGIGTVTAPPLALGLRAAARGIGALKGRLFPGEPPPGPVGGRLALPPYEGPLAPPGGFPMGPSSTVRPPWAPTEPGSWAPPQPPAGPQMLPPGAYPMGPVPPPIEPPPPPPPRLALPPRRFEAGPAGGVESPYQVRGPGTQAVPGPAEPFAGPGTAEPPPRDLFPRGTPSGAGPSPPSPRPRGGGPKIPVITSSGQRVMRSVDALGLEDLVSVDGVTVELSRAGEAQGLKIRRRPDGQVEAVGKGSLDIFPDEAEASRFVQGATETAGPVRKQPVEMETAPGVSTLDKAMRPRLGKMGRADIRNQERQRLRNAAGEGSFEAEIADPARVETEIVGLPDLGKAKVGSVPIRSRQHVIELQEAARASGYKGEIITIPGKGDEKASYEMIYYLARSPNISRAIALHRRTLIQGPADLSPGDLMFVRSMFGKGAGEIASEMGDLRPPGASATAGKPAIGMITKPSPPGFVVAGPTAEERATYEAAMGKRAAEARAKAEGKPAPPEISLEERQALIKSMDIRDAAERALLSDDQWPKTLTELKAGTHKAASDEADIDFPFGANVPGSPPGEARHVRIRGRRKQTAEEKATAEAQQAAIDARKNLLSTLSHGVGGLDLDKPLSNFFWASRGGLLERLGMTREMTAGQIKERLQAGLPGEAPPEVPPIGGGAGPYQWRFANPLIQPQQSQNPLIRQLGEQADRERASVVDELRQLGEWGRERIVGPVGGKGTTSAKRVAEMVRGDRPLSEATPAERGAVGNWREAMAKIAEQEGTPQQQNYMNRVTDFNAIYQALREHFAGKVRLEDLDTKVAFRVGDPQRFAHLKRVFEGFPEWERVPKTVKTELKDLWNFNTVADTWDQLPSFLQEQLPKEYFDRFLIPRTGAAPFMDDIVAAWEHRIPAAVKRIHYDPLIKRWNAFLEQLPGPDLPLTEKRYIRSFLEGRLLGKPTATDQMIEYVSDRINLALGKPLTNIDQLQAAVTLFRSGFYRGALGIDSALTNATQVLNNWAQHGKVIGPIFKHAQAFSDLKARGIIGQFTDMALEDFPTRERSALLDKILRWDQTATRVALAPHSMTEMMNRGAAFAIGMEEAAARGMSPKEMLVSSYTRGTGIVPPLMLSEQVQHAVFRVIPQTQFGMTPTQMAPALRGVLGRISSILVTYPTQQAAFEIRGLVQGVKGVRAHMAGKSLSDGFADAVAAGDAGRLARFLTLTGLFTTLPYIMYEVFGYGVNDTWGMKSVLDLTMNPFWKMIRNGYAAITGYTLADRDQARKELTEFYKTLAIPQYRWGKKAVDVVHNIERGYALDSKARYLYNSTPWGELMRLAGVKPPDRAQAEHLAKRLMMDAYEHRRDKRGAIDAILEGDLGAAQSFSKRWNEAIQPEDLIRVQQERMRPVPQQFGRGLPMGLRQQAVAEEMEGRWRISP